MRQPFLLIFCSLTLFFSCTEKYDVNIQQLQFSLHSNANLGFFMKQENDSLIIFLKKLNLDEKLLIREVRNESLKEIDQIKEDLIEFCGGRDKETGVFNKPQEQKLVSDFMINSQNGLELKESLNKIVIFINKFETLTGNIANDPQYFPEFSELEIPEKTFAEINFDNSTLVGALNTITAYELHILQTENAFLNRLVIEKVTNGL